MSSFSNEILGNQMHRGELSEARRMYCLAHRYQGKSNIKITLLTSLYHMLESRRILYRCKTQLYRSKACIYEIHKSFYTKFIEIVVIYNFSIRRLLVRALDREVGLFTVAPFCCFYQ